MSRFANTVSPLSKNEIFVTRGSNGVVVNFSRQNNTRQIGPMPISSSPFGFIPGQPLSGGIDTSFPNPPRFGQSTHFFYGNQYLALGSPSGFSPPSITQGPTSIASAWPVLASIGWTNVDEILELPGLTTPPRMLWVFRDTQYCRISWDPNTGPSGSTMLKPPAPIFSRWVSLQAANQRSSAGNFTKVDMIIVTPENPLQWWFFSGNEVILAAYDPNTFADSLLDGPKPISQVWPSLNGL